MREAARLLIPRERVVCLRENLSLQTHRSVLVLMIAGLSFLQFEACIFMYLIVCVCVCVCAS